MNIPLISDVTKSISRSYGMLVEDPADDMNGITLRSTVIINPAGTVVHVSTNDAPVGRSVDEVLRLVQAFQYVDKHGEVCPAGWRPGKATMSELIERGGAGVRSAFCPRVCVSSMRAALSCRCPHSLLVTPLQRPIRRGARSTSRRRRHSATRGVSLKLGGGKLKLVQIVHFIVELSCTLRK